MIKVMLADDHKIVREGIRSILDDFEGIEIVAEASNGNEVIDRIPSTQPDLILMDLNMPELNGIQATKYIKVNFESVKILVLSMLDRDENVKELMDLGASGYILKTSGQEELVGAIRAVASGKTFISTDITLNLLKRMDNNSIEQDRDDRSDGIGKISKRELEVLKLIVQGFTNSQIADTLFNSKRTIESHRRNLIEKTGTKNTAELVKYAIQNGFID